MPGIFKSTKDHFKARKAEIIFIEESSAIAHSIFPRVLKQFVEDKQEVSSLLWKAFQLTGISSQPLTGGAASS